MSKGNSHSRSHRDASSVYRKRDAADFTPDEVEHLENLEKNSWLRKLKGFRLIGEPMVQLKNWLYFFEHDGRDGYQTYGAEMQQGLIQLWSTFIVMVLSLAFSSPDAYHLFIFGEALLAGVATQPFVSTQGLKGRKLAFYGILWMLSLLIDFFALTMTVLFLGYLLANPGKLSWKWLCNIGVLRGVPSLLVLLATFTSLLAIVFTTFLLYGWTVGIGCTVLVVMIITNCFWCSVLLSDASTKLIQSELRKKKKQSNFLGGVV